MQVDTTALLRDQKAAASATAAAQSLLLGEITMKAGQAEDTSGDSPAQSSEGRRRSGHGRIDESGRAVRIDGGPCPPRVGEERIIEKESLDNADGREADCHLNLTRVETLPMGAVGHLGRKDRVNVIRKTVPPQKRVALLHRLFYLAQGTSSLHHDMNEANEMDV